MQTLNKKILVVEDETGLRDLLKMILTQEGFRVLTASSGKSAMLLAEAEKPNLILLDLMLPDISGLDVCRTLRERQQNAPIIMLTARSSEAERVIGLSLGANDYIVKPFSNLEVIARVKAQLQGVDRLTVKQKLPELLTFGNAVIDMAGRMLRIGTADITLRHKEFELLRIFATNLNRVLTREDLVAQVWGEEYEGENRVVDVQICRLKEKLSKFPSCPLEIQAIRFVGYRCILTGDVPARGKRKPMTHCLVPAGPPGLQELLPALGKHLSAGHKLLYAGNSDGFERLKTGLAAAAGYSSGQVTAVPLPTPATPATLAERLHDQISAGEDEDWSGTTVVMDVPGLSPQAARAHEAALHGLNDMPTRMPVSVFCLYDLKSLDGPALLDLLHQHAWVLQGHKPVHNSLHHARGQDEAEPRRAETARHPVSVAAGEDE